MSEVEVKTPIPEFQDHDNFVLSDECILQVKRWVAECDTLHLKNFVQTLSASDKADLFEKVSPEERQTLLKLFEDSLEPVFYADLEPDIRKEILESLNPKKVALILAELESDDALDLIIHLDPDLQKTIIRKLSNKMRATLEEGLTFPEDSAGRLMQREVVAIPAFWTAGKTIDYLRAAAEQIPLEFFSVYVVDTGYHVVGEVAVSRLVQLDRKTAVKDVMGDSTHTKSHTVKADMDQEDVAYLFRKEHIFSAPVVDDSDRLIGVITVDDIIDVIQEEAQEDILKLGGVANTDIYRAVLDTTKARFSWLGVNLLTAILASVVIGMFEATLEKVVALAILMPIVASMGGNAGTQALTVAVRALATKELSSANARRVIWKEVLVGSINGSLFAVITGGLAAFWFTDLILGLVIAAAMIINLIVAGFFGVTIPLTLDKFKIDPALASSVFLTTVTDVIGFMAFLGLAALFLV